MKSTGRNTEARRRSLANLRPWQPGQSGNPAGRKPAPDCLTDCLREVAALPVGGGLTHVQKLARVLFRRALAGDVRAAVAIADRLEGRPAQRVELAADAEGGPKPLVFVVDKGDGIEPERLSLPGDVKS